MTLHVAINYITFYRRYDHCLLLILTSLYCLQFATSIAATGELSNQEQDAADFVDKDAADDPFSEKAEGDETENKHFMDVYALQSGPQLLEFGHVFEDPNVWEQRYEKKDFDDQRYQGKVIWGDKDGGYGEQYWDLNHGGANGESAHDDNEENEKYDEPDPNEYVQESRQRAVVYKPLTIKFVKNKKMSMKPSSSAARNVRNNKNPKRLSEPLTSSSTTYGNVNKKTTPVLVFDTKTGVVMDEATGNKFVLKPIYDN